MAPRRYRSRRTLGGQVGSDLGGEHLTIVAHAAYQIVCLEGTVAVSVSVVDAGASCVQLNVLDKFVRLSLYPFT